jgi:hypothetical protein
MSKIVTDLNELNEFEVVLLIYAALLHDVGMAVSDENIELIKNDKFKHFEAKYSSLLKTYENDEELALQEYVRIHHSSLSGLYILEHLNNKLFDSATKNKNNIDSAINNLALICQSHTENYDWLKKKLSTEAFIGDYKYNSQYIASILRLGDILDFDSTRTPYKLYEIIAPIGVSKNEWLQHFCIYNNNKIIFSSDNNYKLISFHGESKNPKIHRKILGYIDWVQNELSNSIDLVSSMESRYKLNFSQNLTVDIKPIGYTYSNFKISLNYYAISSLLMGEKIYGNRVFGLRELVQNSIDACFLKKSIEDKRKYLGRDSYFPKVKIIIDHSNKQVLISDNGIGMNLDVIKNNFLNIGFSYYKSKDFLYKGYNYNPIGNFGIGFLSCFMLSETVIVKTRYLDSAVTYLIELEKGSEYTSISEIEDFSFVGTEIRLDLESCLDVFENQKENLISFLNTVFITDNVNIEVIDEIHSSSTRINNCLAHNDSRSSSHTIDLKNYLNGIEGFIGVKNRSNFINNVLDFEFRGNLYVFDVSKDDLVLITTENVLNFKISDYYKDDKFCFISLPVIHERIADAVEEAYTYIDDFEDVVRRFDRELFWISVLVPKEYSNDIKSGVIESGDIIFSSFCFEHLVHLGQSEDSHSYVDINTYSLYKGPNELFYIEYGSEEILINHRFNFFSGIIEITDDVFYKQFNKDVRLFNKGVLIDEYLFKFEKLLSLYEMVYLSINVTDSKIFPDVKRSNLSIIDTAEINYAIAKTIHKYIMDHFDLSFEVKLTLGLFIEKFYSKVSRFEIQ